MSYDPTAYFNPEAIVFVIKNEVKIGKIVENTAEFRRAKRVVERVASLQLDLTNNYSDWLNIGFSLATFGEDGRTLFHEVSRFSAKYSAEETDKKFDNCLAKGEFKNAAFLFKIAKENHVTITKSEAAQAENLIFSNEEVFSNGTIELL